MRQGERTALLSPERTVTRQIPHPASTTPRRCTTVSQHGLPAFFALAILLLLGFVLTSDVGCSSQQRSTETQRQSSLVSRLSFLGIFHAFHSTNTDDDDERPSSFFFLNEQHYIRRVRDQPGFFGYSAPRSSKQNKNHTSTSTTPIFNVSYNHRSFFVNQRPLLLLGGSLHPVRHTPVTWAAALDEAVAMGLNLITVYVMWSAHQPFPDDPLDWRLPGSAVVCGDAANTNCWTLATALQQAARRRLWVHLRIGPYVCAEYNYGGLPEWVALQSPNTSLRRPNRPWLTAMQGFVENVTAYVSSHNLWAYQGGNVLLGQIENELQGDIDVEREHILWVSADGDFVDAPTPGARRANLQDYADWCGQLVQRLEPHVIWTMCEGLSASNTIETFNGVDGSGWIDRGGSSQRVQKDYPAMWTEFEGGFQIWGDDAPDPSDYFWGQTGRQYAFRALRWIARGGTHMNYYMFSGGYNRDRMAAAGITNMYASDAPLCSSGERRQPKFDHLQRLHGVIRDYARWLLASPTRAYPEQIQLLDEKSGTWIDSADKALLFRYRYGKSSVVFVENLSSDTVWARWNATTKKTVKVQLNPLSVAVYQGSQLQMDSSQIDPKAKAYTRYNRRIYLPPAYETKQFSLPLLCEAGVVDTRPIEQTQLMLESRVWSDYAWYSTEWNQTTRLDTPVLTIETQLSNAMIIFLDGRRVAWNNTHPHKEGDTALTFSLPTITPGPHRLIVLSESLGYDNVIGVWGASTDAKTKGITGNVLLSTPLMTQSLLMGGQQWCSCAGLFDCRSSVDIQAGEEVAVSRTAYHFWTPQIIEDERMFVRVRRGRGHLILNGVDLGRFWNITRSISGRYSQPNYLLPKDYLREGEINELMFEHVFGDPIEDIQLGISHIAPGIDSDVMEDLIDFPRACL